MHGTLSALRRRGDYRQGAAAAGDPWVRSLYQGEGREGQKEETPPPTAAKCLASCLRHALHRACNMRATEERQQGRPPPPPHTSTLRGRGRRGKKEGGRERAPADKAAGGGGSRERVRDGPHDRACRELAPSTPPTGGPPGVRTQDRKGHEGGHTANPPPPAEGQVPRACTAAPQQKPEDRQQGRPLHPPLPHPPRKGARTARGQRHMYHRCPAQNIERETNIVRLPVAILGNLYRRACDMLLSVAWKFSKTLGKMLGSFGSQIGPPKRNRYR